MKGFKGLLYLAILTATVVGSWIGLSIHHEVTTSTISSDTSIIITPIPPSFDRETIEAIKTKKIIKADLTEQIIEPETSEATVSANQATGSAEQQL